MTKEQQLKTALEAIREWLINGHRGAYGEPVTLKAMLEVIDSALTA